MHPQSRADIRVQKEYCITSNTCHVRATSLSIRLPGWTREKIYDHTQQEKKKQEHKRNNKRKKRYSRISSLAQKNAPSRGPFFPCINSQWFKVVRQLVRARMQRSGALALVYKFYNSPGNPSDPQRKSNGPTRSCQSPRSDPDMRAKGQGSSSGGGRSRGRRCLGRCCRRNVPCHFA